MKKVLIITYYWPPSGGGGVQRWLKFSKYLPEFGWEPIVFTPEGADFPVIDNSLLNDVRDDIKVIKFPIWEPYNIFKKFTGRKKEEKVNTGLLFDDKKKSFIEKIFLWIRGNFLIPDPRKFWIKPASRYLKKILPSLNIDVIVTTGTPHSMHLIGLYLKNKFKLPWIVDIRDPWSKLDILDKFYTTNWARNKQKQLEKKVLNNADKVLTVSKHWGEMLSKLGKNNVEVITNGFDEDDFVNKRNKNIFPDKFRISHVGIISSYRINEAIWSALNELCNEIESFNDTLELNFIGTIDNNLINSLNNYPNLKLKYNFKGYLPHSEIFNEYKRSAVLLLLLNNTDISKGHIPGKLFEYLAAGRPILAIGPEDGDVAEILNLTKMGEICSSDKMFLKSTLLTFYNRYERNDYYLQNDDVYRFTRKKLSENLTFILDEIS